MIGKKRAREEDVADLVYVSAPRQSMARVMRQIHALVMSESAIHLNVLTPLLSITDAPIEFNNEGMVVSTLLEHARQLKAVLARTDRTDDEVFAPLRTIAPLFRTYCYGEPTICPNMAPYGIELLVLISDSIVWKCDDLYVALTLTPRNDLR